MRFVISLLIMTLFTGNISVSQNVLTHNLVSEQIFFGAKVTQDYLNYDIIKHSFLKYGNRVDSRNFARLILRTMFKEDNFNEIVYTIETTYNYGLSWNKVSEIKAMKKNSSITLKNISLEYINEDKIVFAAFDTTGFLSVYTREDDQWACNEIIRFNNPDVYLTEVVMKDENVGFGVLYSYMSKNVYSAIIKTTDCWKTYQILYKNPYTLEEPSIEMSNLRIFEKPNKDLFVIFKRKIQNKLIYLENNFFSRQIVDFTDFELITNFEIISDKIFFVLSKKYDGFKFQGNDKLRITTDGGKTWSVIYEIPVNERFDNEINQVKILNLNDFALVGQFKDSSSGRKYCIKRTTNGGKDWFYIYEYKDVLNKIAANSELIKLKLTNIDVVEYNLNNDLFFGVDAFRPGFTNTPKIVIDEPYSFRCVDYSLKNLTLDFGRYYYSSKPNQILSSPVLKISPAPDNDTSIIVTWGKINNAQTYIIKLFRIDPYRLAQIEYITDLYVNLKQGDTIGTFGSILKNYEYLITAQTKDIFGTFSDISYYYYKNNGDNLLNTPKIIEPKPSVAPIVISNDRITFNWTKVDNAQFYDLKLIEYRDAYLNESGQLLKFYKTYKFMINNYRDSSYNFSGLQKNCKYVFKVVARNNSGVSNEGYLEFLTNDFLNVTELTKSPFYIYPNPTDRVLNIRIDKLTNIDRSIKNIEIYNSIGILVKLIAKQSLETDFSIDVSDLPVGIYFIKYYDNFQLFYINK